MSRYALLSAASDHFGIGWFGSSDRQRRIQYMVLLKYRRRYPMLIDRSQFDHETNAGKKDSTRDPTEMDRDTIPPSRFLALSLGLAQLVAHP